MLKILDYRKWVSANIERATRETRRHCTFIHGTSISYQVGFVATSPTAGGVEKVVSRSNSGRVKTASE